MEQVIVPPQRRIFQGEAVPAGEKVVSLFDPHTDIIKCGKENQPIEYGHKVWLNEGDGGIVSHYRVLEVNPPDTQQWEPSLQAHDHTFGHPPHQASTNRGVYSQPNEQGAQARGVKRVILPQPGHRSKTHLRHECSLWFVQSRRWHADVEGRISVVKPAHGLRRCLDHGWNGFKRWVGMGIIAGNLAVMGRA